MERELDLWHQRLSTDNISDYFAKITSVYPINNIYYPGSRNDSVLEKSFDFSNITYLDQTKQPTINGRYFIKGKIEKSPFRNGTFDAAFIQDLHPEDKEIADILRVVKMGDLLFIARMTVVDLKKMTKLLFFRTRLLNYSKIFHQTFGLVRL